MNTKIQGFNQYLLERYPTTWNTKILPIIGISLGVHFLFFIIGFTSYNPLDDEYDVSFGTGLVFFNVIVSILILLYWIISLSKNNAFKDYYPTSVYKLSVHFIHYFVIVFFATTFYISYQVGITTYVNTTLFEKELDEEIEIVNKAAIFFSMEKGSYTGANKPNEISYYNYDDDFIYPRGTYYNGGSGEMNSYVTELLDSSNHKEKITKILEDFLKMAKKYDIKTNLTVEEWLDVIYSNKKTLFGINRLISNSRYLQNNYKSGNLYLDKYTLSRLLNKQLRMFDNGDVILFAFHYFMWMSLIFAIFIFIIRTTSLRMFLFSVVTAALLSIGIGLLLLLIGINSSNEESLLILPIFICLLILILPYFLLKDRSGKLSGIMINIGFPAFPLLIIFSIIYISATFRDFIRSVELYLREFDDSLIVNLLSFAFFITVMVFVYSRCFIIKKWKGLPEG